MASVFTPDRRGGAGPPLVLLHGFTDTWRTWELALPILERHHDVLAPTLAGHAGGPPLPDELSDTVLADAVERAMDEAGFATAHVAGNSLGGYGALQLAARGRAESVVAFAPAGGWRPGDADFDAMLDGFVTVREDQRRAAAHAEALLSTREGRRRVTRLTTVAFEHIPPELVAHQMLGAAACRVVGQLVERARTVGYRVEPERVTCPVRIVWGTRDELLPWPSAAVRFRTEWFPHADWVVLDDVGHAPQLDVPLEAAQLILGVTGGC